jgi:hypothetical protein
VTDDPVDLACEFGRRVFEPHNGEERIAALRVVLSSREPARIDGVFVEYHWARMILELYEEVGAEAKLELAETPVSGVGKLIAAWAKK